jgi:glutaredoxin
VCPDCRVVEKMLKEIKSEIGISLKAIDVDNMDYEFAFKLLSHQIYVSRTPTMILEEDGDFKILFSGIPNIDDLRKMVRGDTT